MPNEGSDPLNLKIIVRGTLKRRRKRLKFEITLGYIIILGPGCAISAE